MRAFFKTPAGRLRFTRASNMDARTLIRVWLLSLAALIAMYVYQLWIGQFEPQHQMQQVRTAESYAMEHPQNVYVCMPNFVFNSEAFKTYPNEKPTNLLDWCDTGMYSGWKTRQLERNGIEPFQPDVFRKDNVYLMGTYDGKELLVLFNYLVVDAGATGYERVDSFGDGFAIFKVVY